MTDLKTKFQCGEQQGTHLTLEELCYVTDKSFYSLTSLADKQTAVAIAMAESGGWTGCVGDCSIGFSLGLWQIHVPAHRSTVALGGDAFNAYDNAGMAAVVYRSGGFKNWSTYKDNSYQQFLPMAKTAWSKKAKPAVAGSTAGLGGAVNELPATVDAAGHALSASGLAEGVPGVPQIKSVGEALAAIAEFMAKGAGWLGNPHNWLRIAFVGLGAGVVVTGLAKLAGVNAGTVAGVVPAGKLAGAVGSKVGTAEANSAKTKYRQARAEAKKPKKEPRPTPPIKPGSTSSLPKHHPARKGP